MKNKIPFYKNGYIVGLALFVIGAAVISQYNTVGGLMLLTGLVVLVVTPIKRLLDRRKARAQAANAAVIMSDLNRLEIELAEKNRQLVDADKQLLDRAKLLAELKEELKTEAQKQVDQEYERCSANLRQAQKDLLEVQAKHDVRNCA